jgi:glutamate-1-semialdehyde aminotransferase
MEDYNLLGNITIGLSVFPISMMAMCHCVNVVETRKTIQHLRRFNNKKLRSYIQNTQINNSAISFTMMIGGAMLATGMLCKFLHMERKSRRRLAMLREN